MKISEEWLQPNGLYKCPYCQQEKTKKGIASHILFKHLQDEETKKRIKKFSEFRPKRTENNRKKRFNSPAEYCSSLKGKTYEEIYGIEKANELKRKQSEERKGKTSGYALTPEKEIERRKKLSDTIKKRYEEGWSPVSGFKRTKYYEYKDIKVHGKLELKTCYILDELLHFGEIKSWEYTNDRIKYLWEDNSEHMYLIDFKVYRNDDTFYYLEVKGWEQDVDKLKWEQTRKKGFELIVWKTKEINSYYKKFNLALKLREGGMSAKHWE